MGWLLVAVGSIAKALQRNTDASKERRTEADSTRGGLALSSGPCPIAATAEEEDVVVVGVIVAVMLSLPPSLLVVLALDCVRRKC